MLDLANHETFLVSRAFPNTSEYLSHDTNRFKLISKMVPNEAAPLYHEVSPLTVGNLNLEVTKVHILVLFDPFFRYFAVDM